MKRDKSWHDFFFVLCCRDPQLQQEVTSMTQQEVTSMTQLKQELTNVIIAPRHSLAAACYKPTCVLMTGHFSAHCVDVRLLESRIVMLTSLPTLVKTKI